MASEGLPNNVTVDEFVDSVVSMSREPVRAALLAALLKERGYRRAWTVPATGAWHLASWGEKKPSDVAVEIYVPLQVEAE